MFDFVLTQAEQQRINKRLHRSVFKNVDGKIPVENPTHLKPAIRASARVFIAGTTVTVLLRRLVRILLRRDVASLDSSIAQALALYTLAVRLLRRHTSRSLTPLVAAPALLLIKHAQLRLMLVLYTLSASAEAGYELYGYLLPNDGVSNVVFSAYGVWMTCQARLLYSFVYRRDIFPPAFARLILARSSSYLPSPPAGSTTSTNSVAWPSPRDLLAFIASSSEHTLPYPPLSKATPALLLPVQPVIDTAHPSHTQAVCAALHPAEPSCMMHYLRALSGELVGTARFAGVLALVGAVLKLKTSIRSPRRALTRILTSIAQGAALIGGSLTTSWATLCVLQKTLPNHAIPKARWSLHCVPSTLLLALLPKHRRRQLAMYCARLVAELEWKGVQVAARRKLRSRLHPQWTDTGLAVLECLAFGGALSMLSRAYDTDKKVVDGIYGGLYSHAITYLREGAI